VVLNSYNSILTNLNQLLTNKDNNKTNWLISSNNNVTKIIIQLMVLAGAFFAGSKLMN
jgi:hypothetical protein